MLNMDHKNLKDGLISAFLCQQHGAKCSFHCKALSLLFCSPPTIQSSAGSAKGAQSSSIAGNWKPTLRKFRFCLWKGRLGKPIRGFKDTPTGGGPRRECLVAWGKNCCSAGAVMLNPRRFPRNASTQHVTTLQGAKEENVLHLYKQEVERRKAPPPKTLHWALYGCSMLFSTRTEWFDAIATITMYQAIEF